MDCKQRNAFTLIELIMVIAIIGVLSVSGAWLMVYFVQNSIYIPNQLNTDMVATDALKIMIEGDNLAKGLRFSKSVSAVTGTNDITFVNQDSQTIRYYLSSGTLYRSIAGGAGQLIPYYASSGINMSAKSGTLFAYYDVNENPTSVVADIRRIVIGLIAQTGSGSYNDWQGQSEQGSSIAVKKFQ